MRVMTPIVPRFNQRITICARRQQDQPLLHVQRMLSGNGCMEN